MSEDSKYNNNFYRTDMMKKWFSISEIISNDTKCLTSHNFRFKNVSKYYIPKIHINYVH